MRFLILLITIFALLFAGCNGDDNTATEPALTTVPPDKSVTPLPDMPQVDDLINKTWLLTEVKDSTDEWKLSKDIRIELEFSIDDDQQVISGYSGCNTYTGVFGIDENALFIDDLTYTERACLAEDAMLQEGKYLSALGTAHSLDISEDGDSLIIGYGLTVPSYLVFQPKPAASPAIIPSVSPTPKVEPSPAMTPVIIPTPQLMPGSVMVSIYIEPQKSGTQAQRCEFPVNIGFYPPDSDFITLAQPKSAIFYFSGTASCVITESGTRIMVKVGPVNPGTYDITADGPTTLLNVKRNVHVE